MGDPWLAPILEVGEVDIGGEVLAADVLIDGETLESLLEEVGSEGSVGAAMIEGLGLGPVVDGEHFAGLPEWQPVGEVTVK